MTRFDMSTRACGRPRIWCKAMLALACGASLLGAGAAVQAAPIYTARLLEIAPAPGDEGVATATQARGINDSGVVVGRRAGGNAQAARWGAGATFGQALADPAEPWVKDGPTTANAVNASGMVAGGVSSRVGGGVVWRNGSGTGIAGFYAATGINNAGVVVGDAFEDYQSRPAQWFDGMQTLLQMLPDSYYGSARAINNLGTIAGSRNTEDGRVATLWEGGAPLSLDIFGMAIDINDRGQVVGQLEGPGFEQLQQGFLWGPDGLSYLNPLAGVAQISALNADGLVVGWSQVGPGGLDLATLWEAGQALDLNALVQPNQLEPYWVLRQAYDINDLGWIVGDAVDTRTGDVRGFVLTPQDAQAVPEPPALALMLAALGLGALVLRRRA